MADLSLRLPDVRLQDGLAKVVDREGKIPRALDALGPVVGRDVVVLHADGGLRVSQIEALGGHVTPVPPVELAALPSTSADVFVACWSAIRPGEAEAAEQVGHAVRVLRPHGRLLVVHDYGRDDVSGLLGPPDRERQLIAWSNRNGPFLANGFKLRVLHCWWSWDTLEDAAGFLAAAFGEEGTRLASAMRRPRLTYKVGVYHRNRDGSDGPIAADPAA